jgi:putative transposase
VITIVGKKHGLWRAVDQDGFVLDVLVQSRRGTSGRPSACCASC